MSFFTSVAPLIGGLIQGGLGLAGANKQAKAIEGSSAASSALIQQEIDRLRADDARRAADDERLRAENAPFLETSTGAINRLRDMFLTGATPISQDPGQQFRVSEGNKALDRSAASRGQLFSGSQLRATTQLNQDLAEQNTNNVFNRLRSLSSGGRNQPVTPIGGGAGSLAVNLGGQSQNAALNASEARRSGFNAVGNAANDTINNFITLEALRKRGIVT